MSLPCPHCGEAALPEDSSDGQTITCPACGGLSQISHTPFEVQALPIEEPPIDLHGFDAVKRAISRMDQEPNFFESLSGQWALFLISLRSMAWIPASLVTTAGLLAGLFLFYVGHRLGALASLAMGSIGAAVALWAFATAAVTTGQFVALRLERKHSSVGFFRSLRLLMEHGTGTLRRLATWVFLGWVGFWFFNITVVGSSLVGLLGDSGRTLLGVLLGAQVLMILCGLVWIVLILGALVTQPTLSLQANLFSKHGKKNSALMDAWRIWGPESPARRPLMTMTGGLAAVVLSGGIFLFVGYGLVVQLDRAIAGKALLEILAASPLAGLMGIPLAAEPPLSLQVAGMAATVSLAAVTGLLLGMTASYWGLSGHILRHSPSFSQWMKNASKKLQNQQQTQPETTEKSPVKQKYDGSRL